MADELTITLSVQFDKGSLDYTFPATAPAAVTITGDDMVLHTQEIGTSEEAIILGDVDISANTGAWFVGINRDTTNYIEIRPGTGVADMIRMEPGEPCFFKIPPTATAPFAVADTAACKLEYMLVAS